MDLIPTSLLAFAAGLSFAQSATASPGLGHLILEGLGGTTVISTPTSQATSILSTVAVNATVSATPTEPCALISASQAAQSGPLYTFSPEVAYQCLNSVPVDEEGAMQLLDDWEQYIQWQSTLA